MGSDSPLHRALAAWRAAEHLLDEAARDDPIRARLSADVDRQRRRYQALFEQIEDVAGHGAPFADRDDPAPPGPGLPPDAG